MNKKSNFQMKKYLSSSEEDTEALERALHDGYNPNYVIVRKGATALHWFAKKAWLKSLRILLNHSTIRTDVLDHKNRTRLHYAARASQETFDQSLEVTNLLLDSGLEIDAGDEDDCRTPLFIAIYHKNVGLTALLLERGANTEIRIVHGRTPLMSLMNMCDRYEDSVLEELVSMLLFYNVDVNCSFRTHPLFMAVHFRKEFICNLLTGHCVGYHLQDYVEQDSFHGIQDFCVKIVDNCVINNFHVDTIINIVDKLNFTTYALIQSLQISGRLENPKLFNHLYDKLKLRDIEMEDCKDLYLEGFFICSRFNRIDFMSAIEKLLDIELNIRWSLLDISGSYYELFISAKPRLNLQLEDMERILYQMFLVCHEINFYHLYNILEVCLISDGCGVTTGFTDDFEIFLRSGIRVFKMIVDPAILDSFDPCLIFMFGQILFPYRLPVAGPPSEVKSLLVLSRDVIRHHLQPRVSDVQPQSYYTSINLFRYYDGVQRLHIPQVIKDIIVLKHQASVVRDYNWEWDIEVL